VAYFSAVTKRDLFLLLLALPLFAGAAVLGTAPMRRTKFLKAASLTTLEQEAKKSPEDTILLIELGKKQRDNSKLTEAYESFTKAAELSPSDFEAWSSAAELAEGLYGSQGAFDLLGTFARNNPNEPRVHLALARLYFLKNGHERAAEEANAALKLDSRLCEAWRIIGWEGVIKDTLPEAEQAMQKAVEIDPNDFRNHVGLGDVRAAQGHFSEAVLAYRKAIKLAPTDANAQRMLAHAILKASPTDASTLPEIEILLRKSMAKEEGRAITHIALGELFERRKNNDLALQEYETATLLEPNLPDPLYRLSQLYQIKKKPIEAEYWAARHRAMRNFVPAEKILKEKIQGDKEPSAKLRLVLELAQKTAAAGLLKEAERQLQEMPDSPEQKSVMESIQKNPLYSMQHLLGTPSSGLIEQGDARLKTGDVTGAQSLYFAAVRRNRYQATALQNVGLVFMTQGKKNEALPFLVDAIQNDSSLSRAHFALGDLAHGNGDGGQAKSHYELGLKSEPGNIRAWLRLGVICRDGQLERQASDAFAKAYELASDQPECAREWASVLEDEGKTRESEAVLRKSLVIAPNESETMAQLGVLLLEKTREVVEAERLLLAAQKISPENTYVAYGLALVRIEQKRSAEACALLEPLVKSDPKAREVWFALGTARRDMGDLKRASDALDRARQLEQQFLKEHSAK
jgi:tetratricopeptide (TPR) repeat protein